jgi:hypothetical protein
MSTPTPRTDGVQFIQHDMTAVVDADLARTLERELAESRNAERLARVQLGNERAQLDDLISVNATGAARLAHVGTQLAAERKKVRVLRLACERIVAQWDADHDANPIGAGGRMYSLASKVLTATEDENGGSNE